MVRSVACRESYQLFYRGPVGSRQYRNALAAASLVIIVGACSADDNSVTPGTSVAATTSTTSNRPDDGVLSLGVFLPITGPGAPLGVPMIEAIEDAVVLINAAGGVIGEPVILTVVDEGTDTGFAELLAAGVDAIIGPASSVVALSQLDATVQPGSTVVTCSPTATALALDDFPDNGYFFRTVASDSLQMAAIARRAERTGVSTISIGYLDDPYGRGLASALADEVIARDRLTMIQQIGFDGDDQDLTDTADALLDGSPGVVVVVGDADDGSRLLAALDEATAGTEPPQIIVNDSIRGARQTIQSLTPVFREHITGVATMAQSITADGPEGFFTAQATDCVNLIALAAVQAESDSPSKIQANMASASVGGRACSTFADCAERIEQGLQIDFSGASGQLDLSTTTGDVIRAWFEAFTFDVDGGDVQAEEAQFEVS